MYLWDLQGDKGEERGEVTKPGAKSAFVSGILRAPRVGHSVSCRGISALSLDTGKGGKVLDRWLSPVPRLAL